MYWSVLTSSASSHVEENLPQLLNNPPLTYRGGTIHQEQNYFWNYLRKYQQQWNQRHATHHGWPGSAEESVHLDPSDWSASLSHSWWWFRILTWFCWKCTNWQNNNCSCCVVHLILCWLKFVNKKILLTSWKESIIKQFLQVRKCQHWYSAMFILYSFKKFSESMWYFRIDFIGQRSILVDHLKHGRESHALGAVKKEDIAEFCDFKHL